MKTRISETPDIEAGKYISSKLKEHASENILLLLSGGSAFSILDHIETADLGAHITVGLVDERFTTDTEGNNYIQLQHTLFYAEALQAGVLFIESLPLEMERHEDFAKRTREAMETYFRANPSNYAIGIFGIGEDGHTAGIFPTGEEEFTTIYRTSDYYVPITQQRHAYPFRTTVTPSLIEEILDDVVLYAVGTNKCENILDYMYNRTFTEHEIPALIPASHPHSTLFTDCPTLIP